jgi:hypothetical protein
MLPNAHSAENYGVWQVPTDDPVIKLTPDSWVYNLSEQAIFIQDPDALMTESYGCQQSATKTL